MDLEQLRDIENLSVRAFNICKTSSLSTINQILNWYKKYGNFKNIRNCGNNTSQELVVICLKYIDLDELDTRNIVEVDVGLKLVNAVSVRAYNVCLFNGLDNIESLFNYYKVNGSFNKFRNCGLKTNLELVNFCNEHIDYFSKDEQPEKEEPFLFLKISINFRNVLFVIMAICFGLICHVTYISLLGIFLVSLVSFQLRISLIKSSIILHLI